MSKILYPELSYEVQGVIYDVYNKLGPGYKEEVYQKAMMIGLSKKGLKAVQEKPIEVFYKNFKIGLYRPDIIVEDKIILELKAIPKIISLNFAQLISYLKISNYKLGILINFGGSNINFKRVVNNLSKKEILKSPMDFHLNRNDLLYSELTKRILNNMFEIHSILGPGFFHHIYRRAAWNEFNLNRISFLFKKKIEMSYEGEFIAETDIRLFIIEKKILLSVLAVKEISNIEIKKMKIYLNYFQIKLGLIINFNGEKLKWKFIRN